MINIQISYDMPSVFQGFDQQIEATLIAHCQDLELQGSGAGFGRRDLEFWATSIDADTEEIEQALQPLFLNNLQVLIDYDYQEDEDEED